jgi:hypothetical protein
MYDDMAATLQKFTLLLSRSSPAPNLTVMEGGVFFVRENTRNRKPPERRGLFITETGISCTARIQDPVAPHTSACGTYP